MLLFDRVRQAGAMCLVVTVAGCQSGESLGAFNLRQPAPAEQVTAEELLAYCPPVVVSQQGAVYNSYQRGGQDDPSKLSFRASIIEATRSCTFNGGMMGMTVAIAGRVVPGPAGAPGAVRVPLRISLYRDSEELYNQRFDHEVAISGGAATQFVVTDTGISTARPSARNMRVVVRYEEASAPRRR
mgnify:CR=1 FL=1